MIINTDQIKKVSCMCCRQLPTSCGTLRLCRRIVVCSLRVGVVLAVITVEV